MHRSIGFLNCSFLPFEQVVYVSQIPPVFPKSIKIADDCETAKVARLDPENKH